MSDKKLRRLPLAAAAMVACMSAHAGYTSEDGNFSLSGFGTLGAAKTSTNDAGFNYPGQGSGNGTTPSLNPDSKLAVQGSYKATSTVSLTTQVMTKYDAEGNYVPSIDWAFGKWQAMPGLTVRAGRMGAPFFMISDFRDVGYANLSVRPALDVYGQVPVSQFDGADVSYQMNLGSTSFTATLWAGDAHSQFAQKKYSADSSNINALTGKNTSEPSDVDLTNNIGLNLLAEMDNGLTVRLGHMQGKLSITANGGKALIAGAAYYANLGAVSSTKAAAASSLFTIDDVKASFTGLGVSYDHDNFVFSGEYTKRKTDSYVSDTTAWYGLVGYRLAKYTPYVGLSKVKTDHRESNPFSASGNAYERGLYASAETILNTQKLDQHTTTLGLRWDATSNMALKGQWDRVVKPTNSAGMFFAPSSTFVAEKRTVNVMSVSLDFVF
jgi:hypothetical protein